MARGGRWRRTLTLVNAPLLPIGIHFTGSSGCDYRFGWCAVQPTNRTPLRFWYDLPLKFKGAIVISIPLLCILYSGVALYIFQGQRVHLDQWIARAFHAGARIQSVVTLLVDAENGVRGFLLTRDET